MTRSNFCLLNQLPTEEFYGIGECPLDSGGYFVVKGSEKVLIAQERMAANQVYTFKKQSPYTFFSTVTSHMEKGGKMPSETEVRMYPKASGSGTVSHALACIQVRN
jgi:DNA-directed RNA polymerase II subunit RPB2